MGTWPDPALSQVCPQDLSPFRSPQSQTQGLSPAQIPTGSPRIPSMQRDVPRTILPPFPHPHPAQEFPGRSRSFLTQQDQAGSSVFPAPFPRITGNGKPLIPRGRSPGSGRAPAFPEPLPCSLSPGAGILSPAAPGVVFLPGTRSGKCREGGDGAVVLAGRAWNSPGCEIPPVPTVVFPVPWIPPHSYPGNVLAFPNFPGVSKSRCSSPVLFSLWIFQVGT